MACGASIAVYFPTATVAGAAAAADSSPTALQEVIVTSTKRSVNLQKAPVAITAVSGKTIEAEHIVTIRDLSDSQPGLSFSQSDAFDQQIAIRGIVTIHLADATAEPSVATFVDGVYIGGQGTTLLVPTLLAIGGSVAITYMVGRRRIAGIVKGGRGTA